MAEIFINQKGIKASLKGPQISLNPNRTTLDTIKIFKSWPPPFPLWCQNQDQCGEPFILGHGARREKWPPPHPLHTACS